MPIEKLPPSPVVKEFVPYVPKAQQISETAENQKSTAVSNLNSKSAAEKQEPVEQQVDMRPLMARFKVDLRYQDIIYRPPQKCNWHDRGNKAIQEKRLRLLADAVARARMTELGKQPPAKQRTPVYQPPPLR